jgi:hypothetical protein
VLTGRVQSTRWGVCSTQTPNIDRRDKDGKGVGVMGNKEVIADTRGEQTANASSPQANQVLPMAITPPNQGAYVGVGYAG